MKLVIFGLAVSSSWGNGHAALWRGLIRAFGALGHHTVFFERDVPYYAQNRDLTVLEGGRLVLYDDWEEVLLEAKRDRSRRRHRHLVLPGCSRRYRAGSRVAGTSSVL